MAPAPSPRRRAAVWALNELARRDRTLIARVLAAFDRLKRAQTQARPVAIREANAALRGAVDAAVDRAAARLAESGGTVTLATRRRLDATLRGAAAGARDALAEGALTQELAAPGFEVFGDVPLGAVARERRAAARPRKRAR
jgi:hypothetical protein